MAQFEVLGITVEFVRTAHLTTQFEVLFRLKILLFMLKSKALILFLYNIQVWMLCF